MGPLLYSLVRFVKPSNCLEIGAGLGVNDRNWRVTWGYIYIYMLCIYIYILYIIYMQYRYNMH